MGLIRMVNEKCPYCGSLKGECAVQVSAIETLELSGLKETEKNYFKEFVGKHNPREAYFVEGIVCRPKEK